MCGLRAWLNIFLRISDDFLTSMASPSQRKEILIISLFTTARFLFEPDLFRLDAFQSSGFLRRAQQFDENLQVA